MHYLFNVIFFSPSQVKETGDLAIAGGYVDIVSALDKPSALEPVSNRSIDL